MIFAVICVPRDSVTQNTVWCRRRIATVFVCKIPIVKGCWAPLCLGAGSNLESSGVPSNGYPWVLSLGGLCCSASSWGSRRVALGMRSWAQMHTPLPARSLAPAESHSGTLLYSFDWITLSHVPVQTRYVLWLLQPHRLLKPSTSSVRSILSGIPVFNILWHIVCALFYFMCTYLFSKFCTVGHSGYTQFLCNFL